MKIPRTYPPEAITKSLRWRVVEMVFSLKFVWLAAAATYLTIFLSSAKGQASVDSEGSEMLTLGPSKFVVPGAFPTSVYKSYYNDPTATSEQPQPVISDPVLKKVFPFELTNPTTIPTIDTADPHPLPTAVSSSQVLTEALTQIQSISSSPIFAGNACQQCLVSLEVAKFLALSAPDQGPNLAIELCNVFHLSSPSGCNNTYNAFDLGNVLTQIFANMDAVGYDGQAFCAQNVGVCPQPTTSPLNLTGWFAKPKPDPLPPPRKSNGRRLKVLHLSDFHIDPRFMNGAEANCSSGLCCRTGASNSHSPNQVLLPAPRFGAYSCDTPQSLALAALKSIPVLTGTEKEGFAFTIFTGDLVSHDSEDQLSRDYVQYAETIIYDLYKTQLNSGPVYIALGNHDTYNEAQDAPHNLPPPLDTQYQWNYDHVTSLWQINDWISPATAASAKLHYAAYMVQAMEGFRIITLNTDFWYNDNFFNYINLSSSDNSGMLRFLTDELQDAEDVGDRVWILGHVPPGWDGTNAFLNPANLFYQIVERFSPHVIANTFFGHNHEDQFSIFYENNGTVQSADTALAVQWIAPSVTPLTNVNSAFRMYEVDADTFDILDAHTWFADVNSFPELDNQMEFGPTFSYEYNTRETYGQNIAWPKDAPLNATWWHLVTEEMEKNSTLVDLFRGFDGRLSVLSPPCTGDCIAANICYMRSGSASLAIQNCMAGFGSVQ